LTVAAVLRCQRFRFGSAAIFLQAKLHQIAANFAKALCLSLYLVMVDLLRRVTAN
jgi:hypothetical protein